VTTSVFRRRRRSRTRSCRRRVRSARGWSVPVASRVRVRDELVAHRAADAAGR
jgi:hypothetical protein